MLCYGLCLSCCKSHYKCGDMSHTLPAAFNSLHIWPRLPGLGLHRCDRRCNDAWHLCCMAYTSFLVDRQQHTSVVRKRTSLSLHANLHAALCRPTNILPPTANRVEHPWLDLRLHACLSWGAAQLLFRSESSSARGLDCKVLHRRRCGMAQLHHRIFRTCCW